MMSSYGEKIKLTIFGESHGEAIGAVIDGVPAGFRIDMDKVLLQMARRAPGKDKTATPRLEKDFPSVKSGILNGVTTGAPIACVIENTNTRSADYSNLLNNPRPGHSDYTAFIKYGGNNDIRGGGHFSGRLTAPIVFVGAVLRQILEQKGIKIAAHISSIGDVKDEP
ncbi:MAG: chorismate synthase, partial [Ruminococcus sp.]|nr:chorismate synthase [Ruminococcus sp.]